MSADPIAWAISKSGLGPIEFALLVRLAQLTDPETGSAGQLSRQELGDLTGCSPRRAADAVGVLQFVGAIAIVHTTADPRRSSATTRNQYILKLDQAVTEFASVLAERTGCVAAGATRVALTNTARVATATSQVAPAAIASRRGSKALQSNPAIAVAQGANPVCLVCIYIKTTRQDSVNPADHEDVFAQLGVEVGLSRNQIEGELSAHDPRHLRSVLDYVITRHRAGAVRPGKAAPYFLSVLRSATPESLGIAKPALDIKPAVAVRTQQWLAADAEEAVERERARRGMRETEDAWNGLGAKHQEELRAQFMVHLAEDNRLIFDSLRRKNGCNEGLGYRLLLQWLINKTKVLRAITAIAEGAGDE